MASLLKASLRMGESTARSSAGVYIQESFSGGTSI